MKKNLLLLLAAAAVLILLFSCEESVSGPDLTGILKIRDDLTAEQWNEGHDDSYNDQWYTYVTVDTWGSQEAAAPNFSVVSWADEDSDEYAAHPQFLMAVQGYGYGKFLWRVYDIDDESSIDNGFVAGDTVQVSIDVWVPDLSGLALAPPGGTNGAWFDIMTAGIPVTDWATTAVPGTPPELVRLVKYHSTDPTYTTGSGGWVTLTKQVVVDLNGVVDILVKLGNQNPDKTMTVYFDNLEVTKVTAP